MIIILYAMIGLVLIELAFNYSNYRTERRFPMISGAFIRQFRRACYMNIIELSFLVAIVVFNII